MNDSLMFLSFNWKYIGGCVYMYIHTQMHVNVSIISLIFQMDTS